MKRGRNEEDSEIDSTNNCLMLVSKVDENYTNQSKEEVLKSGDFKCKTCNKEFLSFQALGGHRASHNKVKLMGKNFSLGKLPNSTMKTKMHMCPICGLKFAIGQALGGHMRKHRVDQVHDHDRLISNGPKRLRLSLDLNLTPYENDLKYLNHFILYALSTFA